MSSSYDAGRSAASSSSDRWLEAARLVLCWGFRSARMALSRDLRDEGDEFGSSNGGAPVIKK